MDPEQKVPFPIPQTVSTVETVPLSMFLTMVIIMYLRKSSNPFDLFLILI